MAGPFALLPVVLTMFVGTEPPLPPAVAATLDSVPALVEDGRIAELYKSLQAVLETSTPEQLQSVQDYLLDRGIRTALGDDVPLLRLRLVQMDEAQKLRRPGPLELPLFITRLARCVDDLLAPAKAEIDIAFRIDTPHEIIDDKFELLPSLSADLEQAIELLDHLDRLRHSLPAGQRAALDLPSRAILTRDLRSEARKAVELRDELSNRLVQLALVRVQDMAVRLHAPSASYYDRIEAIKRLCESHALLESQWSRYARVRRPARAELAEAEKMWKASKDQLKDSVGRLHEKAYHFEAGKRWWLRARYGQGLLANGTRSPATIGRKSAELGPGAWLSLARSAPQPENPFAKEGRLLTQRLHTRDWIMGPVDLVTAWPNADSLSAAPVLDAGAYQLTDAPPLTMLRGPANIWQRTGWIEFQRSLAHFARLLELTNPAEQDALDQMVARDDRFAIYSHLSRQFNGIEPNSPLRLAENPALVPKQAERDERRGLKWMIALCRVELLALLARSLAAEEVRKLVLDTQASRPRRFDLRYRREHGNEKERPLPLFELWPPTSFEESAYTEVLWDAARQHYYLLRLEYGLKPPVLASRPDLEAWAVRFAVARELLEASRASDSSLNATQHEAVERWNGWLTSQRDDLLARIRDASD